MRSGAILALTDNGVIGWAIDHGRPDTHFRVVVLGNGQPLGVAVTTDPVGPFVRAACGEDRPSFTISPKSEVDLEFPLELELRDTDGALLAPPLTIEHPEHIDPRSLQLAVTAYEGFCDNQADGRLEGWAWNMCIPQLPVILEIMHEGEVLDLVRADRFRPDLVDAGKRDGSCGFSVALPVPRVGKLNDEVTLRIAGTGFHLQHLSTANDASKNLSGHHMVGSPHATEQQLLSMGSGHPNLVRPDTPGSAVMQPAVERDLVLASLEARLDAALGAQHGRLDKQEAILTAVKGTVDNLVRTWLQLRNDIALLRADFTAIREAGKIMFPNASHTPAELAKQGEAFSSQKQLAGEHPKAVRIAHGTAQTANGIPKPPMRQRSIKNIQKRKVPANRSA